MFEKENKTLAAMGNGAARLYPTSWIIADLEFRSYKLLIFVVLNDSVSFIHLMPLAFGRAVRLVGIIGNEPYLEVIGTIHRHDLRDIKG